MIGELQKAYLLALIYNLKKAIIIGSGFSGLSTASFLAKYGWNVTVIEKHNAPGGGEKQIEDE